MRARAGSRARAIGRAGWILILTLWIGPLAASADATRSTSRDGFQSFCLEWMGKLAERERSNRSGARLTRTTGGVRLEHVGYSEQPVRCESRVRDPRKPGMGVLVYDEIRYHRFGKTEQDARASEPQVVERVAVTELFRYDGKSWTY